jgi:hypothetical protein
MSREMRDLEELGRLGRTGDDLQIEDVRRLMELARSTFRFACRTAGIDQRAIGAMLTKFHDAGRRSPPTTAFSSILPGRPQSGSDGNRTRRWLLDVTHKFYADETKATLVEVKYILQALSLADAPGLPDSTIQDDFIWLIGHRISPGEYRDPVQLIPISFTDFCADRRLLQSGHLYPLDRGGRHEPGNTFLMLARSNQLQGNNTLPELLALMTEIAERHAAQPDYLTRITKDTHTRAEAASSGRG